MTLACGAAACSCRSRSAAATAAGGHGLLAGRRRQLPPPAASAEPGPALERELIDYVRARIAHYQAPRSVDFVSELPRTPTGMKLVMLPDSRP